MIQALKQRDPDEAHRAATPLELFVDLAAVIAIAAAAAGLHHGVAAGHVAEAILPFLFSFFAIWWAWMNYTWFASAYDDHSWGFKIGTFVFLTGALVLAAGISEFMESQRTVLVLVGYIIMRVAMIYFWLSAARGNPGQRKACLRYAVGIGLAQLYWIGILGGWFAWSPLLIGLYIAGIVAELAVPYWAEKATMTPWHRHHMIERYGLLNIIVMGEMLLAISRAVYGATEDGHINGELIGMAVSAAITTFALWWLYFSREDHLQSRDRLTAFIWGYGHILIFGAGAATGAGFAVVTEILTHHAHVPAFVGHAAVAIPVATYLLGLWLVRDQFNLPAADAAILPVAAMACLAAPFLPYSLEVLAAVVFTAAIVRTVRTLALAPGAA